MAYKLTKSITGTGARLVFRLEGNRITSIGLMDIYLDNLADYRGEVSALLSFFDERQAEATTRNIFDGRVLASDFSEWRSEDFGGYTLTVQKIIYPFKQPWPQPEQMAVSFEVPNIDQIQSVQTKRVRDLPRVGDDLAIVTSSYYTQNSCPCMTTIWNALAPYGGVVLRGTLETLGREVVLVVDPEVYSIEPVRWLMDAHPEWIKKGKLYFPVGIRDGESIQSTAYIPSFAQPDLLNELRDREEIALSTFFPNCPTILTEWPSNFSPACFIK